VFALARRVQFEEPMSRPRPVFPGRFLFITRRCTQRQFLLRPDDETNNAFTYILADAAQRFEIKVVLSQMMSNHHHTVVFDPHGHQVEFREHLHKLIAKSQNALRDRWENLWSSEEPCVVEVMSADDLLDKLVYVATNPVKDGLVEKVHHWPGPKFVSSLLSGTPMRAIRPKHFFRENGPMPEELELQLQLPDDFEEKDAFIAELRRRIVEVEEDYARERQRTGRRVLGRRSVLRQSWRSTSASHERRGSLRPRVAARSAWLRIATLQRNKVWETEYDHARLLWKSGVSVEFPYGTYWLQRFASVTVKPPDPA
jgi:REP element-mobilizing transposase RayT